MAEEYKQVALEELGQIKLSDISEMGSSVPLGRYRLKLGRVTAPESKSGTPMVVAGFDVIDGTPLPDKDGNVPNIETIKGLETRERFTLWVGRSEAGRIIAPGIMEFKAAAAAVGRPLPDDFRTPSNVKEFAHLVRDTFHPKSVGDLEGVIYSEQDRKDKTKTYHKLKIVGRWGGNGTVEVGTTSASSGSIIV